MLILDLSDLNGELEHYGLTVVADVQSPARAFLRPLGVDTNHYNVSVFNVPFNLAILRRYSDDHAWNWEISADSFPKQVIELLATYQDRLNKLDAKQVL